METHAHRGSVWHTTAFDDVISTITCSVCGIKGESINAMPTVWADSTVTP